MKVLLDTCTFLWITLDTPELSKVARKLFRDPDNEVCLYTVSDGSRSRRRPRPACRHCGRLT